MNSRRRAARSWTGTCGRLWTRRNSSACRPGRLWKELGAAGLLGLLTPEEYGGSGGDQLAVALLAEELARASGGIAVSPLVSAYMAAPHIVAYGSIEQRARHLPALACGDSVAAIAVTEPGSGSDVAGITSSAVADGAGYRLNGRKMFITNAAWPAS